MRIFLVKLGNSKIPPLKAPLLFSIPIGFGRVALPSGRGGYFGIVNYMQIFHILLVVSAHA
jgi:hypothetical protein